MNMYDKQNIRLPDEVISSSIGYYRKIDATNPNGGIFTSWNWSAFLFTTYWLVYRRCYKYAVLSVIGTFILSSVISTICIAIDMPDMASITNLIVYFLYGLFGNSMYINGIKEKIFNLQAKGLSDIEIIEKTRPSWTPPLILFGISFAMSIGMIMHIFGIFFLAGMAGAM